MGVPIMMGANLGLLAAFLGGGLLLLAALWWSYSGDGKSIARERWPGLVRALVTVGWLLWVGGLVLETVWLFGPVRSATFEPWVYQYGQSGEPGRMPPAGLSPGAPSGGAPAKSAPSATP